MPSRRFLRLALLLWLTVVCLDSSTLRAQSKPSPNFATLSSQANAARDANRLDEAVSLYQKSLALHPTWAEGWWSLGTIQYDTNSYAAAARSFQKLLLLQPKSGMAHAMLGLCQFELGLDKSALEHLEAATEFGISSSPELRQVLLYHQAVLLQRSGKFERAQSILQQSCLEGTKGSEVDDTLGMTLLRMTAKTTPAAGTPDRKVVDGIGEAGCLGGHKNYDEAKTIVAALTAEYPKFPNIHYASGLLLLDTGDTKAAITQFQEEIQNDPQNILARLKIAAADYKMDSPAGIPYAEEAVRINPRVPLGHYVLGLLLLDTGDFQRAIPELETASASYPNEAKLYFALGSAYAQAGRKQDAAAARAKFERLNQAQKEKSKGESQVADPGSTETSTSN